MSLLKILGGVALLCIPVSFASATIEQPETAAEDITEILVIGEKARKKRIQTFIKSAIRPTRGDQYARYHKRVCPVAMGLPEEHNRVIEQRMLQVADAAGIKTGKPGCRTNMGIVIVHEAVDFMSEIRSSHPTIFNGISIIGRDRIMAGSGPAYAWNIVETRGGDGSSEGNSSGQFSNQVGTSTQSGGGGPIALHTSAPTNFRSYRSPNSRLVKAVRQELNMSVVLIEKSALEGVDLRQVADYGLLRLLTDTRDIATDQVSERSILTLFSDRKNSVEPPLSITAWDFAFLKALYKTPSNRTAAQQRSAMARKFDKELVKMAQDESVKAEN